MNKQALAADPGTVEKPRVGRSIGVLVSGQAAAQVLTLAVSPILTRLYSPQDFGAVAVFAGLLAFVGVVACLRYDLSINLPASDRAAENLVALCLLCVTATSALCALGVLLFGDSLILALNWSIDAGVLWLLPFGVAATGLYTVMERWMVRKQKFGPLAQTRLVRSVIANLVQLGGYGFGVLALMGGTVIGQGAGGLVYAIREIRRRGTRNVKRIRIVALARRYKDFPLYSTWTAMFNVAGVHLVPLIFSALFGAAVVGYFAFALRMISAPISLIGAAIGSVFFAQAPAALRAGHLPELAESLRRKLANAGIPALVLLICAGPDLFAVVFGERWRMAGHYARWMAPWIYFQFQFSPLSCLPDVMEQQRMELFAQFSTFAVRLATLAACYGFSVAADSSVAVFSAVSAVAYLGMLTLFMSRVGIGLRAMVTHDARRLLIFCAWAMPSILLFSGESHWRSLVAAAYFLALSAFWMQRTLRPAPAGGERS
ncbi:lipopolysaccharide biosynthesis protein [Cupriavidus pauculus]|uniref:lipopolysaccharide biosynthesis protein n=1 Tax=Cupriavidus pauculus TaxID=82633 RepID=UPI001EE35EBF|nr:oligosaccharide flippase family protein [Cupriavidus pauculus]GJG94623.1 lipopolysaccharide biosynthesis protein [Cupriavidus pauculus]